MSGHRWRHSWDEPLETGLVVVVPEAAERVGPVRDAFDPYAAIGVPPHITVLYPFVGPELLSDAVIEEVAGVVGRFAPFGFELTHLAEFEGEVFYLAPDPADPFVAVTQALWDRFPDHPPYGGQVETIVPHLSVAGVPFGATRGAVEHLLGTVLPIVATATGVTIMIEDEDGWTVGPQLPFRDAGTAHSIGSMASIDVAPADDTERLFTVTIGADDGSSSAHTVGVSDADWDRFGGGFEVRTDLVEASLVFLLEREPKESILGSFELGDIARYFPEYGETFTARSSG